MRSLIANDPQSEGRDDQPNAGRESEQKEASETKVEALTNGLTNGHHWSDGEEGSEHAPDAGTEVEDQAPPRTVPRVIVIDYGAIDEGQAPEDKLDAGTEAEGEQTASAQPEDVANAGAEAEGGETMNVQPVNAMEEWDTAERGILLPARV